MGCCVIGCWVIGACSGICAIGIWAIGCWVIGCWVMGCWVIGCCVIGAPCSAALITVWPFSSEFAFAGVQLMGGPANVAHQSASASPPPSGFSWLSGVDP